MNNNSFDNLLNEIKNLTTPEVYNDPSQFEQFIKNLIKQFEDMQIESGCYKDLYNYLFPLVILKTQRDQPIGSDEFYQDMELFKSGIPLPPNKFLYKKYPAQDKLRYIVRPNFDTSYNIAYLDLRKTPVIINVPIINNIPKSLICENNESKKRFWGVQLMDGFTNTFSSTGTENNDTEGSYIITGPSWRNDNMDLINWLDPPTNWFLIALFLICIVIAIMSRMHYKLLISISFAIMISILIVFGKRKWRQVYESPTDFVWVIVRIRSVSEIDAVENVFDIQKQFNIQLLDTSYEQEIQDNYEDGMIVPKESYLDPFGSFSAKLMDEVVKSFGAEYFYSLASYMLRNHVQINPEDTFKDFLMESIGLSGKALEEFNWNFLPSGAKNSMSLAYSIGGYGLLLKLYIMSLQYKSPTNWVNIPNIGTYGKDYNTRAVIALQGLGANPPKTAVYMTCFNDSSIHFPFSDDPSQLDGSRHNYTMTFSAGQCNEFTVDPPVKSFWSFTVYDKDGYPVANLPIHSIGSDSNLVYETNGDLVIRLENDPAEGTKNWLPIPLAEFSLTGRFYLPDDRVISQGNMMSNWYPPSVVRVAEPEVLQLLSLTYVGSNYTKCNDITTATNQSACNDGEATGKNTDVQ